MSDLSIYTNALARMFEEVDTYVRDTDEGPGWSILLDVGRTPNKGLGWLAQFVGVTLDDRLADAEQRQRIRQTDGFRRGSPDAIRGAAQPFLTGNQTVQLYERDGSPYVLTVVTFADETPDPDAVESALRQQKPAGIVLNYQVVDGQIYEQLLENHPTYDDVLADYATYQDVLDDNPASP